MLRIRRNLSYIFIAAFSGLFLAGCAGSAYLKPPVASAPPGLPGVYHRVEKGQTLWRISKIYGVELEELAAINRITDASSIETGQQLFVPNRTQPQSPRSSYSDSDDFIWPLRGRVTGAFGQNIGNMLNKGINIQPASSLNVLACASGRVVFSSINFAGMGRTIIIDHENGLFTVYGRNAEVFVRLGDKVAKGAVIAKVGSHGRNRQVYLHFEVRRGALAQNPLFYLP